MGSIETTAAKTSAQTAPVRRPSSSKLALGIGAGIAIWVAGHLTGAYLAYHIGVYGENLTDHFSRMAYGQELFRVILGVGALGILSALSWLYVAEKPLACICKQLDPTCSFCKKERRNTFGWFWVLLSTGLYLTAAAASYLITVAPWLANR